MKFKEINNPFLLFFPFLILYTIIILVFATPKLTGDEGRYLSYAANLSHGFYTHPPPFLDLGNGPGYPLFITPFVALGLPLIFIKLANGILYYLSVIFLFKSLRLVVDFKFAVIFSIIWALYPNTFSQLPHVAPEVFTSSLVPLLLFCCINLFKKNATVLKYKYILITGAFFGYLALTKPIFGYVLTFLIGAIIILWLIYKRDQNFKISFLVILISLIVTLPWLVYTHHMTGKFFYWSSYGGNNLYWMTSPYKHEFGDWQPYPWPSNEKTQLPGTEEIVKSLHQKDFEQIFKSKKAQTLYIKNGEHYGNALTGVIQDDTLKSIAVRNIIAHPKKFVENIISNAGRMLFNYPNSYTIQKPSTLKRLPINGTILVFTVFCLIITITNWKTVPFSIRFLLFFSLIYFGGSLLGSAGPRMFTVIVPILLFWIAFILKRTVVIKMKLSED